MQPQAPVPSRPVMDIAPPRPASTPLPAVPVQRAPADQADAVPTPEASVPAKSIPEVPAKNNISTSPQPKVAHTAPIGLIVTTLLVMLLLSGLAVLVYLKSQ